MEHKQLRSCGICRAESAILYLKKHPEHAPYYVENQVLPYCFKIALFAADTWFFDPCSEEEWSHYHNEHIFPLLESGRRCLPGCDAQIGGCVCCAQYRALIEEIGEEELQDIMGGICEDLGVCPHCWNAHLSDSEDD